LGSTIEQLSSQIAMVVVHLSPDVGGDNIISLLQRPNVVNDNISAAAAAASRSFLYRIRMGRHGEAQKSSVEQLAGERSRSMDCDVLTRRQNLGNLPKAHSPNWLLRPTFR
jgi:predicted LPLAT superfamily acyltransferase